MDPETPTTTSPNSPPTTTAARPPWYRPSRRFARRTLFAEPWDIHDTAAVCNIGTFVILVGTLVFGASRTNAV